MPIVIREHTPGKDVKDFVRAGHVVFEGDPQLGAAARLRAQGAAPPEEEPVLQPRRGDALHGVEGRAARRAVLGADRPRAPPRLEGRHRLLRLLRHDRRRRGRQRAPGRRRASWLDAARDEADAGPVLALRERGDRHPHRGVRHAAGADDGPLAPLPGEGRRGVPGS